METATLLVVGDISSLDVPVREAGENKMWTTGI